MRKENLQSIILVIFLEMTLFQYHWVLLMMHKVQHVETFRVRSDTFVIPVERDQFKPDMNVWSPWTIHPEVTARSSRGWN